jgi:hypothetical protein
MRLLRLVALLPVAWWSALAQPPLTPTHVIPLFNGRDLAPFTTWDRDFGRTDRDHVFTVVERIDDAPALRISGQHHGGLITRERYTNYHLVAEYRWGLLTWQPRRDRARDSGILLHCQGEEGNDQADLRGAYMRSVEYQIIEGGTGDLILVRGYERGQPELLSPTLHTHVQPGTRRWSPDGEPWLLQIGRHRTDWRFKDPQWQDNLGFRGAQDVEKPAGQWNRLEAICRGGDVTFLLNGVKVNEGRDGSYTAGRILIQSEGAEIFFRKLELHPLAR